MQVAPYFQRKTLLRVVMQNQTGPGGPIFLERVSRMIQRKKTKKAQRKSRKTRRRVKRLRGGDYRLYTNQTIKGLPLGPNAVYATASGILSLEQYKEMQERKENGQKD